MVGNIGGADASGAIGLPNNKPRRRKGLVDIISEDTVRRLWVMTSDGRAIKAYQWITMEITYQIVAGPACGPCPLTSSASFSTRR